ncbi:MAG: DUF4123 domain-containing protein [Myxococcales bacterium]|nr:DUF4123 domain-containing protein [Myxococcales bacterium]MCB9717925.1 DUF4123 domain-containing protein [Myxococcales bacterium]
MSRTTKRTINGIIRRALSKIKVPETVSSVYGLVDGAQDDKVVPLLKAEGNDWRCLYGADLPRALAAVAPYLVALASHYPFAGYFARDGRGNNWGVMLRSDASIDDLAEHFASMIRARLPEGREVLFRFYDPRVLRAYLPTCSAEELDQVFGPVDSFLIEQGDGNWKVYRREEGRLVTREPAWDRWID